MADTPFQPNWFSKPGDTLSLLLDRQNCTIAMLAGRMGQSTTFVESLLAGTTAINAEVAELLQQHVGSTASYWMKRQAQFDQCLDRVAKAVPADDAKAWLKALPLREMIKSGWLPEQTDVTQAFKTALTFFGVSSPSEWQNRYAAFENMFAFRTSPTFESKAGPLSAWLRRGEIEAAALPCADWNADHFQSSLNEIRVLTKAKNPSYFIPRLRAICAAAGVAVVFVRAPSGCRASGATRFMSSRKAVIILSFRYLSDDHFWFSFFHEAGHLLLHGEQATFIDGEADERDEKETEANNFSASVLIPGNRIEELMNLTASKDNVIRFATSIGISPGIVVGQMQHNSVIGQKQLNFLKRRYSWEEITAAQANP